MNMQRAQEIAASPVMANVTCDGVPVYIQQVFEDNGTARIYPLNSPEQEREVSLASLTEQQTQG
ncbi:small acid-soluble spore protein H [Paenibacillus konkukensis]|nr:small acid-soluble spore protein H [Paenibacillus konkukensis]